MNSLMLLKDWFFLFNYSFINDLYYYKSDASKLEFNRKYTSRVIIKINYYDKELIEAYKLYEKQYKKPDILAIINDSYYEYNNYIYNIFKIASPTCEFIFHSNSIMFELSVLKNKIVLLYLNVVNETTMKMVNYYVNNNNTVVHYTCNHKKNYKIMCEIFLYSGFHYGVIFKFDGFENLRSAQLILLALLSSKTNILPTDIFRLLFKFLN